MKLPECFRDAGRVANNFQNNKELQRHSNVTFQMIIREIVPSLRMQVFHVVIQMYNKNKVISKFNVTYFIFHIFIYLSDEKHQVEQGYHFCQLKKN